MKMQRMHYTNLLGQRAMMIYWTRLRSDAKGEFVIDTLLPGVPLYMTANAVRQEAFVPVRAAPARRGPRPGHHHAEGVQPMRGPRTSRTLLDDPRAAWEPYRPGPEAPWDAARVAHLHRRAGLGATWGQLRRDVREGFEPSIQRVLQGESQGPGGQPAAEFAETVAAMEDSADRRPSLERVQMLWIYRLIFTPHPLQEVMTLAWHGHYATSQEKVQSPELMLAQNLRAARAVAGADRPAPPPDARRRRHAAMARRPRQHQGPAQREPGARVPRALRPGRRPLQRARRPRGRAGADRLARVRFSSSTRIAWTPATSTTAPRRSWARPADGASTTWCGSPAGGARPPPTSPDGCTGRSSPTPTSPRPS